MHLTSLQRQKLAWCALGFLLGIPSALTGIITNSNALKYLGAACAILGPVFGLISLFQELRTPIPSSARISPSGIELGSLSYPRNIATGIKHEKPSVGFSSAMASYSGTSLSYRGEGIGNAPSDFPIVEITDLDLVAPLGNYPMKGGRSSYSYRGKLKYGSAEEIVTIKLIRVFDRTGFRQSEELGKEVDMWQKLWHPNVAPFYGATVEKNGLVGLVSPFFEYGNVVQYLRRHEHPTAVILDLMKEILLGVQYLHGCDIIHGNMKGRHVLVDDLGHAKITEFRFSCMTHEPEQAVSYNGITFPDPGQYSAFRGSLPFVAPELLLGNTRTTASDVYSVASTFLEMMTGKPPYSGLQDLDILLKIRNSSIPERPARTWNNKGCYIPSDHMWNLLVPCWARAPTHRPAVATMLDELAKE